MGALREKLEKEMGALREELVITKTNLVSEILKLIYFDHGGFVFNSHGTYELFFLIEKIFFLPVPLMLIHFVNVN